jgi:DNA polymerase-3 subunit beta
MPTSLLANEVSNDKSTSASLLEIVVNRDALLAELTMAASMVENKTTIPILSNFLFVADEKGVAITATDLDRSVVTTVPAKVKKPGSITIPARKLYDYVKLLSPGSEISLKALENSWVQIRSGRSHTKMVGMPRGNYPTVPALGERRTIKLPSHALRQIIGQTSFAISTIESRYMLNGALLGVEQGKMFMVATDGHRLALSEMNVHLGGVEKAFTILIPLRAIKDVSSMLAVTEETEVSFAYDESNLFFVVGRWCYASRVLKGNFPAYETVIPRENPNSFVVSAAEIARAIMRVATFADERSGAVKMSISENSLSFAAQSTEAGESEETIATTYSKQPISIGFNSAYLLDFLKAVGGKGEVKISLKDAQSPALLQPEGDTPDARFIAVVMPMRA